MAKKSRNILLPFSVLYGEIIRLRNKLFDKDVFRSASFDLPVICIGNLSVGGTGKSPMVEYVVRILHKNYHVATLSRGYKRKTKGFFIANENTQTADIGDEPMQFYRKFPDITVAVDEDRVMGIPKILNDRPATEVIILDDAFQHRQVKAGLNILLTECGNLYSNDFMLPAGNLRDVIKSSERADIIIVTKCNPNLNIEEKQKIISELKPKPYQKIFFTDIEYNTPYHLFNKEKFCLDEETEVLLVCGIAHPKTIENEIKSKTASYKLLRFKDHHVFDSIDIKKIKDEFSKLKSAKKIILTTEKDATRLLVFENGFKDLPIFVLPMAHHFLFNQEKEFEKIIFDYVDSARNLIDIKKGSN
ncbi:MAG: tetraacyldisaccharide 4'-kinase [Ginsengibacter sp.]